MKPLLAILLLTTFAAQAAEKFQLKSGNGISIPSPIDKTTVEIKDGSKTVKIPTGMVYVPAGKFIFGEDETRELASFAWKLELAGI